MHVLIELESIPTILVSLGVFVWRACGCGYQCTGASMIVGKRANLGSSVTAAEEVMSVHR